MPSDRTVATTVTFHSGRKKMGGGGHNFDEKVTLEINFVFNCSFFLIKRGYNFETANIMRLYAKFNKNSKICDVRTSASPRRGVIKYVKIF